MKKLIPLFLFLLWTASPALACVCGLPTRALTEEEIRAGITKEFDDSVAVFSGEAIKLDTYNVTFKIEKVWKGDWVEELMMSTGAVKIDETFTRSSSCDYDFTLRGKYLVYARKFEAGLVAYKCTGTRPLAGADRELTELDRLNPEAYEPPDPDTSKVLQHRTGSIFRLEARHFPYIRVADIVVLRLFPAFICPI